PAAATDRIVGGDADELRCGAVPGTDDKLVVEREECVPRAEVFWFHNCEARSSGPARHPRATRVALRESPEARDLINIDLPGGPVRPLKELLETGKTHPISGISPLRR